jgi:hypothetical protein
LGIGAVGPSGEISSQVIEQVYYPHAVKAAGKPGGFWGKIRRKIRKSSVKNLPFRTRLIE